MSFSWDSMHVRYQQWIERWIYPEWTEDDAIIQSTWHHPESCEDQAFCTKNGISINRFNLTDPSELIALEHELSLVKIRSIFDRKMIDEPPSSASDYCALHQSIFQDIYPWAGYFRHVATTKSMDAISEIQKGNYRPLFVRPRWIHDALNDVFHKMTNLDTLMSYSRYDQINYLTVFFACLNSIHPFHEGNGRTQRVTLALWANELDLQFKISSTDRVLMNQACKKAHDDGDLTMLNEAMEMWLMPCQHAQKPHSIHAH